MSDNQYCGKCGMNLNFDDASHGFCNECNSDYDKLVILAENNSRKINEMEARIITIENAINVIKDTVKDLIKELIGVDDD